MKILITGDHGTIGKELVKLLSEHEILGLDKAHEIIMDMNGNYMRLRRDIADDSITEEVTEFKPELVFHLAASFERTKESNEAFDHIFHNDVLGSHKLIEALKGINSVKTVIFASSYLIYKNVRQYVLREESPIQPRNLCGYAKFYTEKELEDVAAQQGWRHVNARIFRVYGSGGKEFLTAWCKAKAMSASTAIFNANNSFDFIHARDVAHGLLAFATNSAAAGIINLGTGVSTSVKQIAELIGNNPEKILDDHEFYENSCASTEKLWKITGWKPEITIEQGIKETLELEKQSLDHFSWKKN